MCMKEWEKTQWKITFALFRSKDLQMVFMNHLCSQKPKRSELKWQSNGKELETRRETVKESEREEKVLEREGEEVYRLEKVKI